jgi:hypothetical protein
MNNKNTLINERRTKHLDKSYLITARKSLWDEVEEITDELDVSIAHYIRESIKRNNALYKKASLP